jgi:hypothetical protein
LAAEVFPDPASVPKRAETPSKGGPGPVSREESSLFYFSLKRASSLEPSWVSTVTLQQVFTFLGVCQL